jgi:hypothetical protein
VTASAGNGNGGNSANAKACQKGGWMSMVGADGTTFANQGACVSYGAQGGTFATTGFIIPAGHTATLTDPQVGQNSFQDTNSWGYQLNFGSNVTVGGPLCCDPDPGTAMGPATTTLGPYPTAMLVRVFLHDVGIPGFFDCDFTGYNDQPVGLVLGTNPYTIGINDSEACSQTPTDPYSVPEVFDGTLYSNFVVTLTIN